MTKDEFLSKLDRPFLYKIIESKAPIKSPILESNPRIDKTPALNDSSTLIADTEFVTQSLDKLLTEKIDWNTIQGKPSTLDEYSITKNDILDFFRDALVNGDYDNIKNFIVQLRKLFLEDEEFNEIVRYVVLWSLNDNTEQPKGCDRYFTNEVIKLLICEKDIGYIADPQELNHQLVYELINNKPFQTALFRSINKALNFHEDIPEEYRQELEERAELATKREEEETTAGDTTPLLKYEFYYVIAKRLAQDPYFIKGLIKTLQSTEQLRKDLKDELMHQISKTLNSHVEIDENLVPNELLQDEFFYVIGERLAQDQYFIDGVMKALEEEEINNDLKKIIVQQSIKTLNSYYKDTEKIEPYIELQDSLFHVIGERFAQNSYFIKGLLKTIMSSEELNQFLQTGLFRAINTALNFHLEIPEEQKKQIEERANSASAKIREDEEPQSGGDETPLLKYEFYYVIAKRLAQDPYFLEGFIKAITSVDDLNKTLKDTLMTQITKTLNSHHDVYIGKELYPNEELQDDFIYVLSDRLTHDQYFIDGITQLLYNEDERVTKNIRNEFAISITRQIVKVLTKYEYTTDKTTEADIDVIRNDFYKAIAYDLANDENFIEGLINALINSKWASTLQTTIIEAVINKITGTDTDSTTIANKLRAALSIPVILTSNMSFYVSNGLITHKYISGCPGDSTNITQDTIGYYEYYTNLGTYLRTNSNIWNILRSKVENNKTVTYWDVLTEEEKKIYNYNISVIYDDANNSYNIPSYKYYSVKLTINISETETVTETYAITGTNNPSWLDILLSGKLGSYEKIVNGYPEYYTNLPLTLKNDIQNSVLPISSTVPLPYTAIEKMKNTSKYPVPKSSMVAYGWGTSPYCPFTTVTEALNFINTYYNVNQYKATLYISEGIYGKISCAEQNITTGSEVITSYNKAIKYFGSYYCTINNGIFTWSFANEKNASNPTWDMEHLAVLSKMDKNNIDYYNLPAHEYQYNKITYSYAIKNGDQNTMFYRTDSNSNYLGNKIVYEYDDVVITDVPYLYYENVINPYEENNNKYTYHNKNMNKETIVTKFNSITGTDLSLQIVSCRGGNYTVSNLFLYLKQLAHVTNNDVTSSLLYVINNGILTANNNFLYFDAYSYYNVDYKTIIEGQMRMLWVKANGSLYYEYANVMYTDINTSDHDACKTKTGNYKLTIYAYVLQDSGFVFTGTYGYDLLKRNWWKMYYTGYYSIFLSSITGSKTRYNGSINYPPDTLTREKIHGSINSTIPSNYSMKFVRSNSNINKISFFSKFCDIDSGSLIYRFIENLANSYNSEDSEMDTFENLNVFVGEQYGDEDYPAKYKNLRVLLKNQNEDSAKKYLSIDSSTFAMID